MNLQQVLDDHKLWAKDIGGKRANLFGANLIEADLSEGNLFGANLSEANLSGAYLFEADLSEANLSGANLGGADLSGADLSVANLIKADLSGANLIEADLSGAYLFGADLSEADLSGANLNETSLRGVDLSGAKNIIQWQAPQGIKRICYSVKHKDCVMHQLGCFWGTTEKAVEAIRKKYGEGSLYEKFLLMQAEALEGE